jgi:LmbE family N-acetylglucosaminyl deacetylase
VLFTKVLALSPHADDVELGCGGTLARLSESGSSIFVACFAHSIKPSVETKLEQEFKVSMALLPAQYDLLNFPIRRLPSHRQAILDYLIRLDIEHDFDLILCHSTYDEHQDHRAVQQEAFRAFKTKTILGYELPWNCRKFSTDVFIKLEQRHLDKKQQMLECYSSQEDRSYMCKDYCRDIARTRGLQIGAAYAECFELIRGVF